LNKEGTTIKGTADRATPLRAQPMGAPRRTYVGFCVEFIVKKEHVVLECIDLALTTELGLVDDVSLAPFLQFSIRVRGVRFRSALPSFSNVTGDLENQQGRRQMRHGNLFSQCSDMSLTRFLFFFVAGKSVRSTFALSAKVPQM